MTRFGTVVSVPMRDLAHAAAIRHQVRVVEQQPVEFTKRQPAAGSHFQCAPVAAFDLGRRVEGDREWPGRGPLKSTARTWMAVAGVSASS